ncbi:MAG: TerB family tellurite resistance protein [Alphaproteobacteria bacterium]|nr:TerB family tellurite resistance protein [Alphaproteobacteria bacterium]
MDKQFDAIMGMSDDAKVAYLKAFTRLANADGVFDDSEKAFIKNLAENYVVPSERLAEIFAADSDDEIIEEVAKIKNRRAALELLKELCFLAHADNELSDEETLFIGRIGQAMNVELEKIEQISNWVIDKIILAEEAKIIFEEV